MELKVILDAYSNTYSINTIIEILLFQLVESNAGGCDEAHAAL